MIQHEIVVIIDAGCNAIRISGKQEKSAVGFLKRKLCHSFVFFKRKNGIALIRKCRHGWVWDCGVSLMWMFKLGFVNRVMKYEC